MAGLGGRPFSAMACGKNAMHYSGLRLPNIQAFCGERYYLGNRTFVFDKVTAGPATLSGLSAVASEDGEIIVSGILKHTGGDAGQLQGNKVIVRAEALTATGETAETGTVLATEETAIWVRKGRPQTLNLSLNSMSLSKVPAKVERIRLYLETHPCR